MKALLLFCIVVTALSAGCGNDSNKSASPGAVTTSTNGGSLATAPVDYLNSITKAEQSAIKTVDLSTVNGAIRQFQVEQGRYPKNLDELVEDKYLPRIRSGGSRSARVAR